MFKLRIKLNPQTNSEGLSLILHLNIIIKLQGGSKIVH